jgi:hypothetical protein
MCHISQSKKMNKMLKKNTNISPFHKCVLSVSYLRKRKVDPGIKGYSFHSTPIVSDLLSFILTYPEIIVQNMNLSIS